MTEEMRKVRAGQIGDQGAQAGAGEAGWEEYVNREGGEQFRSPDSSLLGMRRGPKRYDFWIDLKITRNL